MVRIIDAQRTTYGVEPIFRVVGIAPLIYDERQRPILLGCGPPCTVLVVPRLLVGMACYLNELSLNRLPDSISIGAAARSTRSLCWRAARPAWWLDDAQLARAGVPPDDVQRSKATVLVTDGERRSPLEVVRSLGHSGYRVLVASAGHRSVARGSRHPARRIRVPDEVNAPGRFAKAIVHASQRWQPDAALAIPAVSGRASLPARQAIRGTVTFGPFVVVRRAASTTHRLRVAAFLRIPVPQQLILTHPVGALDTAFAGLGLPIFVKPGRAVRGDKESQTELSATKAATPAELNATVRIPPRSAFPMRLQSRIRAAGTGAFLLRRVSRTRAFFAPEHNHETPPSAGVISSSVSVAPNPSLASQAKYLLTSLDWWRPALVDFKRDAKFGVAPLVDRLGSTMRDT